MAKKINDDQLAALRAAHPRGIVYRMVGPDGDGEPEDKDCDDFVFKIPSRQDYLSYKNHVKKAILGQAASDAASSLARTCLLFPSKEEWDELRERAPAIVEELGEAVVEAAAAGLSVREGKR